ncbi:MAG: hypothetical protein NC489_45825 [Ruminococcus flavefaciens]|nr:hypothetical protein [Ruminococcus flavefaciens]
MERSELISKLYKEAAETTPDIYDKILKTAKAEGLIDAGGVAAGTSGAGTPSAVKGAGGGAAKAVASAAPHSRIVSVAVCILASFIAVAAVAVTLGLNIKSEINGGSQIEAPSDNGGTDNSGSGGSNGGNSNIGGGQSPSNPTAPTEPADPAEPTTPVDPNGVKTIAIDHKFGEGKYLWNESDVLKGVYNLYGAELEITRNDGAVESLPLTVDMFDGGADFTAGNYDVTVTYGGKTAGLSVFVAPSDGYIEAVDGKFTLNGPQDVITCVLNSPDGLDFGGLEIKGEFNLKFDGAIYGGYYGSTEVNERFVRNFDRNVAGMQACALTLGNIDPACKEISGFNVLVYDQAPATEERVYLSDVLIKNAANDIMYHTEVSPEKPYIDINDIPNRYEPDYRAEFIFKRGKFTTYSGDGKSAVFAESIGDFYYDSISGDTNLWSVLSRGERIITLTSGSQTYEIDYTVYDSSYSNIRFCRVHGEDIVDYELTDGVTLDSIKADLLTRVLYVEYFEKENGKYFDYVPITEDMIDFSSVDVNSYTLQHGSIIYRDSSVGVNIVKPYTVAGASVLYNLTCAGGVNLILSETTLNDLGQCSKDVCKQIVLYSNGVAMLKHTGNGIGDVLTGYALDGNNLTLLRHGIATSFLTVNLSGKTFSAIDLDSATSGMDYNGYIFNYRYANTNLGWSGTFTAYAGQTGYAYSKYVNVHLTGWASTTDSNGYSYQIAGVEYVATWAMGWHNNKNAFVLRLADKDWWFEIGAADGFGRKNLTFIKTVTAS